jgi:hypothetical protein
LTITPESQGGLTSATHFIKLSEPTVTNTWRYLMHGHSLWRAVDQQAHLGSVGQPTLIRGMGSCAWTITRKQQAGHQDSRRRRQNRREWVVLCLQDDMAAGCMIGVWFGCSRRLHCAAGGQRTASGGRSPRVIQPCPSARKRRRIADGFSRNVGPMQS